MKSYKTFPSEIRCFQDRVSGVNIRQLTGYLGHSNHAYFTNNGWYDTNKRLLFPADRDNVTNLFSIEIESGEISQLTNFQPGEREPVHFTNDVNAKRNEVYYTRMRTIYALNLDSGETRPLYKIPDGFHASIGMSGADGDYVYGTLTEDLSDRVYTNMSAGYIGMRETFYAKPDCRIVRINLDTNEVETLRQENCWIGHVNPSPVRADLLTFCHEGPWELVDHRIWMMDLKTGESIRLREREMDGEKIGHEYWHADGEHVGYQVHQPNGKGGFNSFFGVIKYDGTGRQEAPCVPFPSPDHIHSNDFSLIASDSGKCIKLYRNNGNGFDEARVLAMHDGSFFYGSHHPHPRFTADGKYILYNSNASGYCNLYLAEIPEDVTKLPILKP